MTQALLERIRRGDESALADVVAADWDVLVRHLARRLGSEEEAREAAQEALVRLWERRERWRGGSARALLFRIAANVAADLGRRRAVRERHAAGAAPLAAAPPTPEDLYEADEVRARLSTAIDALAPKRREVFELVRLDGLTYGEVAEALELAPQTVANHMSLALRDLRARLGDLLDERDDEAARARRRSSTDG